MFVDVKINSINSFIAPKKIEAQAAKNSHQMTQLNSFDLRGISTMAELNKHFIVSSVGFKGSENFESIGGKKALSKLEYKLFEQIDDKTPDYVKMNPVIDVSNKGEITFKITKAQLEKYDPVTNPEGLGLRDWLNSYEKEARVSTAGIRGNQNILYPWDMRYPINLVGVALATDAKAKVAKEKYPDADLNKLAATEVRYNSDQYLDLIARIQAANGITTHVPVNRETIPIWLASFLAFKLDLLGGEYVTSSHGISVKNATKDINDQGSQYLPEESMQFVGKIKEMFNQVEKDGKYELKIAASDDPLIREDMMKKLNNGIDLYVDYLKNGVASDVNIDLIKHADNNIMIENVGGSAYKTLSKVLDKLEVSDKFEWFNTEEDPFFHSIGKADVDPKGNKGFYDYSADASLIVKTKDGKIKFPVLETCDYQEKLKNKPIGSIVLITDPDHDRLSITQVESKDRIPQLKKLGIDYMELNNDKVLTVYTPNQGFLLIMDFWAKQLKANGDFDKHPRFMIKTTASAMSWDEWAKANDIKVVNVPVGFKEIANIMKKVEKQIQENPDKPVIVKDVYGNEINLGVQPRMIFAGEESGGMIIGAEEPIKSKAGRIAIAMREKSATEAIVISSALAADLEKQGKLFSENLEEVFNENNIVGKYDVREDISYYNESEPDIDKLKAAKKDGEALRTKNDMFYLSIAMAKREGIIDMNKVRGIFSETFPELDFSNLNDLKFVGDGTYLEFSDKYIEIRPSGTDAKTKAYGAGLDKAECLKYARALGNYSGDRTSSYKEDISEEFYEDAKENSLKTYESWAMEGASTEKFNVPDYSKTLKGIYN